MKNTFKSILTVGFLTFCMASQAQKIGHLHLDSLISMMPDFKTAKDKEQEYYKQLENTVITMQKDLEAKLAEYREKETTMPDLIKQTKQKELQDLNQRIQEFQQTAQQEYQKKQAELVKPVYEKARKAVEQVAKEGGFKYILDTSNGSVIYFEASDNVMGLAKKKLNITGMGALTEEPKKPEAAPAPATPKK